MVHLWVKGKRKSATFSTSIGEHQDCLALTWRKSDACSRLPGDKKGEREGRPS